MTRGGGLRHGSIATSLRPNPLARFLPCRVTILARARGPRNRVDLPDQLTAGRGNADHSVTARSRAAGAAPEGRMPATFRFHDSGDFHDRNLPNPQDDRDGTTAARR